MPNPHTLFVNNIYKSYQSKKILKGISFSVKQGNVVGLLGVNGAGKTTTFYVTVGFIKPDQGSVFIDEMEITHLAMHQRSQVGISYLPQENCIFRRLTVAENIQAILEFQKISKQNRKEKLEKLLEDLDVAHIRNSYGYSLSGGERRRVEIARCLATDPSFILLDEPFAGVDPLLVADIQKIIKNLAKQGIGVLINDHNVRETLAITDYDYLINKGQIILSGNPEQIMNNETARKIYFGKSFKL